MAKKRTTEEWIKIAKTIHGNKYDYSKVIYENSYKKLIIICKEHGNFEQTSKNHLQGRGCPKCRNFEVASSLRKNEKEVIKEFNRVHNNTYDYSKLSYIDMHTKVKIICNVHGEFEQLPRAHIANQGCPSCAKTGFDKNKPAILYYLKITTEDNNILYKIGITNRTVNERFRLEDLKKIEIIKQEKFENGEDAWNKEKNILEEFKEFKYKGADVLDSGNTELFTVDVLALKK